MIPFGRQDINQADIDAVVAVLRSDFLNQCPMVFSYFELTEPSYADISLQPHEALS